MNREVLSSAWHNGRWILILPEYDTLTVGELNKTDVETMLRFVHPDRHEINQGFCFDHVNLGLPWGTFMVEPWELTEFKDILAQWQTMRDLGGWHALYLENHDQVSGFH